MNDVKFNSTFAYKVIYIFRINDDIHMNKVKIGDATLHTDKTLEELTPNCEELVNASKSRINEYTTTAGIKYELLHTELAVTNNNKAFRDHNVHKVLKRSGIKQYFFDTENKQNEWFVTDRDTAIRAIQAVKEGRNSLNSTEITEENNPIILRPEQESAVIQTINQFKKSDRMLWNAKMRFGKTLTTLEVVKRMEFKRTIILTHRPVVSDSWFEDFGKIFFDNPNYLFGSKTKGESLDNLVNSDKNFVYFASIQDLRGSSIVGGKFEKNDTLFNINWDFVVIDEAHEGTKTEQGIATLEGIIKFDASYPTKVLELSGTPFNLLSDFNENEIYTWDYVNEQTAKKNWNLEHFGDSNPYEELPELNIFTYNLNTLISGYVDVEDKAFNFREFFRTWTGDIEADGKRMPENKEVGDFIHESDVMMFLDLISKEDSVSNYPYSNEDYRNYFRHSLWMVPGVKEARALSKLLKQHPVFGSNLFNIINVAGSGDEETNSNDALDLVRKGIGNTPEETYSITLSCGRLTTGVSVPEWTAVFMLAGTYNTSASSYLQTIFRVQTPAKIGGKIKDKSYVFDFAPDRTLRMIAEAGQLSIKAGATDSKKTMAQFLNFCPVISITGSNMVPYDVNTMLQQLKKAYAERVVKNGFDDRHIYNDNLLKLDGIELEEFENLKAIIGTSKQTKKVNEIDINNQGFTNEEFEELEKLKKKPKRELSEEEKERLAEIKKKKEQASTAMSILRGISIRIPLLIYGADIDIEEDINCENFIDIIDDESWEEFMPKGITKEIFTKFSKYYDEDIFVESGRQIRNAVKYADQLNPTERVQKLSDIFATFKNPDKETVLTPWRTVNMHMGDTMGGYNFFDDDYIMTVENPHFIDYENGSSDIFLKGDSKVLELNSKTGLYPLYITYNLYRQKISQYDSKQLDNNTKQKLWNETLKNNVFVACKTPMAKSITKRTLYGYNPTEVNVVYIPNMIDRIKEENNNLEEELTSSKFWNWKGDEKMKFDAIVGNPPYQEIIADNDSNNSSLGKQLFPYFITFAIKMNPQYVSLITPSRWFAGDAQDKSFLKLREFIRENNHISKIYNYPICNDVFDNVTIKGGVSYFLYDKKYSGNVDFYTIENGKRTLQNRKLFEDGLDIILSNSVDYEIIKKVKEKDFVSFTEITKGRNAFGIVGKSEVVESISTSEKKEGLVKLQCKAEEIRWTKPENVTKSLDVFEKYKVFISKSAGDPAKDTRVIGKPYVGEPYSACTDSLIPVGCFDTIDEAFNLQKYMKTQFLRYMVSILKVSQNVYQNVYQFVPMQDFTNNSDIDWNKYINEIDEQLFKKYNLTSEEIEYIKSKVAEVEY